MIKPNRLTTWIVPTFDGCQVEVERNKDTKVVVIRRRWADDSIDAEFELDGTWRDVLSISESLGQVAAEMVADE